MDHQSQRRSDGFSSKEIRNLQSLLKRKRAQTTITNEKERKRERDVRQKEKCSSSLPVRELKTGKKGGKATTRRLEKGESETPTSLSQQYRHYTSILVIDHTLKVIGRWSLFYNIYGSTRYQLICKGVSDSQRNVTKKGDFVYTYMGSTRVFSIHTQEPMTEIYR